MYIGDIKLDNEGYSIITNGDFTLTTSDKEFILNMINSNQGSWSNHPELGIGLYQFVGRQLNQTLLKEIRASFTNFFRNYGIFPELSMAIIDKDAISITGNFKILDSEDDIELNILFNISNGVVSFVSDSELVEEIDAIGIYKQEPSNKYLNRRLP